MSALTQKTGGYSLKAITKGLNVFVLWGYKILRNLGAVALSVMFMSITLGIFTRYVLNAPIPWAEELCTFLMVNLCFISAATTTVRKKHIVADFFVSKAPLKVQKAIDFFSKILMLVFFAVIIVSVYALMPSLVWKSPVLNIPRQYYYAAALACSVFMFITVVTDIINGFVPGFDLIAQENERQKQLEKEQEALEAASIQAEMDHFMADAGYDIPENADKEDESK